MPSTLVPGMEAPVAEHAKAKSPRFKSGYMPTLDGWRAIAILLVMFYHGNGAPFDRAGIWGHRAAEFLKAYGHYGVILLFPLSGLLITSRILEEHKARGQLSLKGFYIRRASRILPPAFTFLIALALL